MIKEANRRPLHAVCTKFPSRNHDTPVLYIIIDEELSINALEKIRSVSFKI